jgi:hypothetical protein
MRRSVLELFLPSRLAHEPDDFGAEEVPAHPLACPGPAYSPMECGGPVVGVLWGLDERGGPLVRFDGAPGDRAVPARSVVPLDSGAVGREAVLLFEQGDPQRPLVMGVLRSPRPEPVRTEIDGEKLVLTAEREIVLRCGEASLTLTRAGKVLIQGTYVLMQSSGANRIKGAVVEIN